LALLTLTAGPLTAEYDSGSLRYIRFAGSEVLRRVLVAVRDSSWHTIPATLSKETIVQNADSFRISFTANHEIGFVWDGSIEGDRDGTIRFAMSGKATRTFWRNRIGICVLHPIAECAGHDCIVEHSDGTGETSHFPTLISPHQPFLDIRALRYGPLRIEMAGDVFETEDQRNWTDASFKTYSTPLSIPIPVEIHAGDEVVQSVSISLVGRALPAAPERGATIHIDRTDKRPCPSISVVSSQTAQNFVDLNRNRQVAPSLTWGINPQVHAVDELTMIENLAAQADTIVTARSFAPNAEFYIDPVLVPPVRNAEGWVAVSFSELAQAGAASVSYNQAQSVIAQIQAFAPDSVVRATSSHPLQFGALVLQSGPRLRAWIANFLDQPQTIQIEGHSVEIDPFQLHTFNL
jgi:hypothetical protein